MVVSQQIFEELLLIAAIVVESESAILIEKLNESMEFLVSLGRVIYPNRKLLHSVTVVNN